MYIFQQNITKGTLAEAYVLNTSILNLQILLLNIYLSMITAQLKATISFLFCILYDKIQQNTGTFGKMLFFLY